VTIEIRAERVYLTEDFSLSLQRAEAVDDPARDRPHNLGALPVHRLTDYSGIFPKAWLEREGVFAPLLENEAIWLGFASSERRPHALQISVGDLNCVSGLPCTRKLDDSPQNYLVCPPQLRWNGMRHRNEFVAFDSRSLRTEDGRTKDWLVSAYRAKFGFVKIEQRSKQASTEPLHEHPFVPRHEGVDASLDPHGAKVWEEAAVCDLYIRPVSVREYRVITGLDVPPPRRPSEVYKKYRLP
jgi:hypothetical protein